MNVFTLRTPKQYLSTGTLLVVFWFTVVMLQKYSFSPGLKGWKKIRFRNECKSATLIAKHLGTRNTRLLKEENWTQNMSEKLSGASSENEKQRIRSTSGIRKKKTKGYGSGKCVATNLQQSWVATTRKQIWCNFYDEFLSCSASLTALQNFCDDNEMLTSSANNYV